jgi:hypothetical protein
MVAMTAGRKEMRAAISVVRSAQADSEVAFSGRVEGTLACIDRRIWSLREQLSRCRTCIMCLSKIQQMNTLAEAKKRRFEKKVATYSR